MSDPVLKAIDLAGVDYAGTDISRIRQLAKDHYRKVLEERDEYFTSLGRKVKEIVQMKAQLNEALELLEEFITPPFDRETAQKAKDFLRRHDRREE